MPIRLPLLPADPNGAFPPAGQALREPNGLLAMGGDLSAPRLLNAYRHGIFPWYSEGEPILWWCPDPRMVFDTASFRLPSRFRRWLRRSAWQVNADGAFAAVIDACARSPRPGQDGTWITRDMRSAYLALHRQGHAHSIEVHDGPRLVGGIYGVAVGRMFFGESMFSAEPGGSKVALAALARHLARHGWPLIDAQVENPHLVSLGGRRLARPEFLARVAQLAAEPVAPGSWAGTLPAFAASELSA
ncbi:leucyl/phenylalanyl-tRNA--protein transferase [Arenimonas sp. MALMAid1274]|uniref:leucyl/phenylalanyl-tRNA--protein transferase n=1 Tax=Arenimonas sp. MALMAid1274 TaxID=3411630 RepID=UPI003B9E2EB1